jgi:cation transport ATPase
MKAINISAIIFTVLFGIQINISAQDSKFKTVEFKVHGVCNQCKVRIENAAYIKGVKHCEWNKETEKITVVYNSEKTDLKKIHNSIAKAGHTTDKVEANKEAYNKLPKCCAYNDGVHKH